MYQTDSRCIEIKDADDRDVPLVGIRAKVLLEGTIAGIDLSYRFRNDLAIDREVTAVIPKPASSVVTGLEIHSPRGTSRGRILEKDDAFEDYDEAVEEGITSALVEMEGGDQLTMALGAFRPGDELELHLHLIQEILEVDGSSSLRLPLTTGTRYASAHVDDEKVERLSMPVVEEVSYGFHLEGKVASSEIKVSSVSHDLGYHEKEGETLFFLKDEAAIPDRDLVLNFSPKDSANLPSLEAFLSETKAGESFLHLCLRPDFDSDSGSGPEEIIYVLDCSGSMHGNIRDAARALECCIRAMDSGTRFNIVFFGSHHETLFSESKAFDEQTLSSAMDRLQRTGADMGGTEMLTALQAAWSPSCSGERAVVLLTDGAVYDTDSILHQAQKQSNLTCYTIGIGYGPSSELIEGLAKGTGGASEMLQNDSDLDDTIMRQFSRIFSTRLTDLRVHGQEMKLEWGDKLGPVYSGDGVSFLARLKGPIANNSLTLKGSADGSSHSWRAEIKSSQTSVSVPKLWAHQKLQSLEGSQDESVSIRRRSSKRKLKQSLDLALQYQVLSRQTGLVVLEDADVERAEGRGEFEKIPVQKLYGHGNELSAASVPPPMACMAPADVDFSGDLLFANRPVLETRECRSSERDGSYLRSFMKSKEFSTLEIKDDHYWIQFLGVDGFFDCWEELQEENMDDDSEFQEIADIELRKKVWATQRVLDLFSDNSEWEFKHRIALRKAKKSLEKFIVSLK
jgi:Ca-activated chloride channel homolog